MEFQEQIDRKLARVSLAEIDLCDPYYQISYGTVPATSRFVARRRSD